MTKIPKKVSWQMGQMLLPGHFVALEEAMIGQLKFFIDQMGNPFYGLTNLQWNESLLDQGVFSIDQMTLITSTGTLINIPENAIVEPLDISQEEEHEIAIYFHLMDETANEENAFEIRTEEVSFVVYRCQYSTKKNIPFSKVFFKLAQLTRSPNNNWNVDPEYIPPLLNVSVKPFLSEKLSTIKTILEYAQVRMKNELREPTFLAAQQFHAKLCQLEIVKILRLMSSADLGTAVHPCDFYESVIQLLDIVFSSAADWKAPPYQHDAIASLFSYLVKQLQLAFVNQSKGSAYLQFERKDAYLQIERLPNHLEKANELFLVIQKPATDAIFSLKNLKLTSRLRLSYLQQFSLSGISLTPVKQPIHFQETFVKDCEIFRIGRDEEWKHACLEENLILVNQAPSPNFQAFLFWK
jgi:type VI secretion system protein ImpJ